MVWYVRGKIIMGKKITPVKIFVPYWIFTLVLYAFGPLDWVTYHPVIFWTLNILFIIAFIVGWQVGKKGNSPNTFIWKEADVEQLVKKLPLLLWINLFYEIITSFRSFLFTSFDVSGLLHRILYGINNMGKSYNSFQDNVTVSGAAVVGGHVITIFNYMWSFASFAIFLVSLLYFKHLKKISKVIVCMTYFIVTISYIARGTNIGVFRVILAFLVFYYIKYSKNIRAAKQSGNRGKSRVNLIVLSIIAIIAVIYLFNKIMLSRGGILFWNDSSYNIGGIGINQDSVFFKVLPAGLHRLLVSLSSYLSQGYYGMSLTLRTDWIPMFGLGSSKTIQDLLSNFFPSIGELTYQSRIAEFGWDDYTRWHSMYSWFANDVSYLGVIVVMFIFGLIFARSYKDSINTNNPFAHLMVYYMFVMAVFLPCNNQIFQSMYLFFSFITVFLGWICTRGRKTVRFKIISR